MEIKNREIKKLNYYLILCLFIFNLGVIIYLCCTLRPSQFLPHLTNWSFVLSSFYLFLVVLTDSCLYFFGLQNLEKFNHFIRNSFSNIVFPYCFTITIGFWVILLIGFVSPAETFLEKGTKITLEMIFVNVYVHLGITAILLIELIINKREKAKLNWCSGITNTIIYIIYVISICIEKYKFDFYPYLFVKNLNIAGMVIVGIIIYGLIIASAFIYYYLSQKINKTYIEVKESGENEKLIKGDDNEQNYNLSVEEE